MLSQFILAVFLTFNELIKYRRNRYCFYIIDSSLLIIASDVQPLEFALYVTKAFSFNVALNTNLILVVSFISKLK